VGVAVLLALLAGACGDGAGEDSTATTERPTDIVGAAPADTDLRSGAGELPVDPYFPGQGDWSYDVLRYDLDARVTIAGEDHLDATMTVVAVANRRLTSFGLDLVGLDAGTVTVDGAAAMSRRTDTKLVVTPAKSIAAGQRFTAVVPYRGEPGGEDPTDTLEDGGGWLDLGPYSAVIAQPVGAPTWIPVNDRPSDKAQVALTITVPASLEAVANGTLVERRDEAATSTFRWEADEPMAPYLITLAIGDYELVQRALPRVGADGPAGGPDRGTDGGAGEILVIDAYPSADAAFGAAVFAPFADMVGFFSQRYGAYPFATAGNVIVPGMPATALECQTRSVFADAALRAADHAELVAHELAHQWFGDAVTPATWQDLWLNEGPAVFSQWLWTEHTGGPTVRESAARSYDPDDEALDVAPADPGVDELFGTAVYERSAIFLVLLRERMGDDAFTTLLRTWYQRHRGGNATTAEFVALVDEVHGSSLADLVEPWLWDDELPEADL